MNALEKAIEVVGSKTKLADTLGVTVQAVSAWSQVPAERCIPVETATGGAVTRYDLRPDVFGPAPAADRSEAA